MTRKPPVARCAQHDAPLANLAFYRCGCRHYPPPPATLAPSPFSLRTLVDFQNAIAAQLPLPSDAEGLLVLRVTSKQLALISYALGILSAERIAAGERLDDATSGRS